MDVLRWIGQMTYHAAFFWACDARLQCGEAYADQYAAIGIQILYTLAKTD